MRKSACFVLVISAYLRVSCVNGQCTLKHCSSSDVPTNTLQTLESYIQLLFQQLQQLREERDVSITSLSNQLAAVNEEIAQLKEENQRLSNNGTQTLTRDVSFTVYLKGGSYVARPSQTLPPFIDVLHNQGLAYDKDTRKFTCPVSGIYYFAMSLYSDDLRLNAEAHKSTSEIYHSRLGAIARVLSENRDPEYDMFAQAATSVIVECRRTETVYIRTSYTTGNVIWGEGHSNPRSVFTGFLINTSN